MDTYTDINWQRLGEKKEKHSERINNEYKVHNFNILFSNKDKTNVNVAI